MYPKQKLILRLGVFSIAFAVIALIAGACSQKTPPAPQAPQASAAAQINRASRDSERLRFLMDQMLAMDLERQLLEMNAGVKTVRDVSDLALTADVLAASARPITDFYAGSGPSEESRCQFEKYVTSFRQHALELGACARDKDLISSSSKLNEVIAACNACHSAFRWPTSLNRSPRIG
ncbi:MAG TPA: hypothetical protein VMV81_07915 [Phycisphaerae bacterium]|nr:hypothetical protein [Phycisphaerae bacterium]